MAVDVGRIGLWISGRVLPTDSAALGEAAAALEELGYQAIWLGMSPEGTLEQPEAMLAGSARIAIATGIVSVWGHPPEVVAPAYHRVAGAHPGRFLLGLGASHSVLVEPTGQSYAHPYGKLVEFLDGLDAAVPPVPPGGRVLAALGPRVLKLSAARTAGAHPYLVTPEHTRRAREILGDGPLLAPEQKVVLSTDPARAREIARGTLEMYLQLPNYTSNLQRLGFTGEDISGGGSDRLVDALVAWGDEETIARRVAEHHAAGADHVCVQVLTGEWARPWEEWRALAPALT
ncbi:MAG: LLM class F420-dependent oxidoreductase [Gemmatimonadota bacterium]